MSDSYSQNKSLVVEAVSFVLNFGMVCFDVVSAFPNVEEDANVFMMPPKGWFDLCGGKEGQVWLMQRSLYGRRTAGAHFRDW